MEASAFQQPFVRKCMVLRLFQTHDLHCRIPMLSDTCNLQLQMRHMQDLHRTFIVFRPTVDSTLQGSTILVSQISITIAFKADLVDVNYHGLCSISMPGSKLPD